MFEKSKTGTGSKALGKLHVCCHNNNYTVYVHGLYEVHKTYGSLRQTSHPCKHETHVSYCLMSHKITSHHIASLYWTLCKTYYISIALLYCTHNKTQYISIALCANEELENIMKTMPLRGIIYLHHLKYIAHACRAENTAITKKLLFAKPSKRFYRNPWLKIADLLGVSVEQVKRLTQSRSEFAELVRQRFSPSPWRHRS